MRDIGFVSALVLGFALGAGTVGPCCWWAAKLHRAVADRRAAWATHRGLLSTIWSFGLRTVGLGVAAIVVIVILVAVRGGGSHPSQVDHHMPLPATSSSTPGR